ncbi:MAG: Hsp70 family protein [Rubrobacter sp.]|nr:Hsp70 family protein [Rubrobacter sp.]
MAWYDPRIGDAEVLLNAEGQTKTPSLAYFGENETLVGETVENLIEDVSTDRARRDEILGRTIASIKRNLLSPPRIALPGGRYVRPVEVVAEILKKLKHDAEDGHFHQEVGRVVITCPAEFNVLQRQKIEEASHLAGFSEVVLLEEPAAGALAYTRAGLNVGEHVLVYDLGGGTFDLAVLDNEGESFQVAMEPKGMERCGGDDFDLSLYHHCDEVAREKLGRSISLTGAVDLSFLRACRRRKENLSFQERSRFNNYLSSDDGPVLFEHEVDRQTFEELIGEYVKITTRLTKEILSQANAAGYEIDTVVLIGGSVRVPLVIHTLEETLPVNPLGFNKRDVAVALGAAHYTNVWWPAPQEPKTGPGTEAQSTTTDSSPPAQRQTAVEEAASDRKPKRPEVDHRLDSAPAGDEPPRTLLPVESTPDRPSQRNQDERFPPSQTTVLRGAPVQDQSRQKQRRVVLPWIKRLVVVVVIVGLAGLGGTIWFGGGKGASPAPGYDLLEYPSGKLSVEVPTAWKEHVTTNATGENGKGWDSFAGESVIGMTAGNDLHSWSSGSKGSQGMYIAASKKLAQSYTDDQLVTSGPHDYSSSCQTGPRRDFDRAPYSGKIQEWDNCGGTAGHTVLTLAAAPKGRGCEVLLQIGGYLEGEEENIQHILDTFEADCGGIS